MKITLINPYDFTGPGIRSISSLLRANGYQVQNMFLLKKSTTLVHSHKGLECSQKVLAEIFDNCQDQDLIGITLMTNAFNLAAQITQYLKKYTSIPVIWGGIHPTINPDECLEYADMVCVGEGENPMLNLLNRLQNNSSYLDVEGIWFNHNGKFIKNRIAPLIQDLTGLPPVNYDYPGDKVLQKEKIVSVNHKIAEDLLGTQLSVYFSRGCPYRCSFCCNNTLNNLYKNQRILRYKSPEFMVNEICSVLSKFKRINRIFFCDDSLIEMPLQKINEFSRLYKTNINLPFSCLVTANSVNKQKIEPLVEAGLNDVRMGIQSASPRILEIYNRPIQAETILKSSKIIHECFNGNQLLSYDLILDNPYETKEDKLITLRFLLTLPQPFTLRFFSMQLYPGTQLYTKVYNDKEMVPRFKGAYYESYESAEGNYLNFLFYLMKLIGLKRCPDTIGKVLLNNNMIFLLDNPLTNTALKGLRNLRSIWRYSIRLRFLRRKTTPIIKKSYTNL